MPVWSVQKRRAHRARELCEQQSTPWRHPSSRPAARIAAQTNLESIVLLSRTPQALFQLDFKVDARAGIEDHYRHDGRSRIAG